MHIFMFTWPLSVCVILAECVAAIFIVCVHLSLSLSLSVCVCVCVCVLQHVCQHDFYGNTLISFIHISFRRMSGYCYCLTPYKPQVTPDSVCSLKQNGIMHPPVYSDV